MQNAAIYMQSRRLPVQRLAHAVDAAAGLQEHGHAGIIDGEVRGAHLAVEVLGGGGGERSAA